MNGTSVIYIKEKTNSNKLNPKIKNTIPEQIRNDEITQRILKRYKRGHITKERNIEILVVVLDDYTIRKEEQLS